MEEKLQPGFHDIDPKKLKPHPCNPSIYGKSEDLSDLVELIAQYGIQRRLIVNIEGEIVSGNRRNQAALILELPTVAIEVRAFNSRAEELELLLIENATRTKTILQKVREGKLWKEIEEDKAAQRRKATQNNLAAKAEVQNFAPLVEKGKVRDIIAKRVGLGSGYNYSKAIKVVELIERYYSEGKSELASGLQTVLNSGSIDAAHKLLKQPDKDRERVLAIIAKGEALTVKEAQKLLKDLNKPDTSMQPLVIGMQVVVNEKEPSYPGAQGEITSMPNPDQAIVLFNDGNREMIDRCYLEPAKEKLPQWQQKTKVSPTDTPPAEANNSPSSDSTLELIRTAKEPEFTIVEPELKAKQEELGLGRATKNSVLPETDRLDELQHSNETDIDERAAPLGDRPFANPNSSNSEDINPNAIVSSFINILDYLGAEQIKKVNRAIAKRKKEAVTEAAAGLADSEKEAVEIVRAIALKFPNAIRQAMNEFS